MPPLMSKDSDLLLQGANFDSGTLTGIAYGINLAFVGVVAPQLWRQGREVCLARILLLVLLTMLMLCTISLVGNTVWHQQMFVNQQDFPGGPGAFYIEEYSTPPKILANVAFASLVWINVGLMVYRCIALYAFTRWQIIVQAIMYLTCIAAGVLTIVQFFPNVGISGVHFVIPFVITALTMDVELAIFIATRLLSYRLRTRDVGDMNIGESDRPNAVVIWLESAALSTSFGTIFLVTYLVGSPISELFLDLLPQIKMMASALVMLRIASAGKRTTGVRINFDTRGSSSHGSLHSMEQVQVQVKSSMASPGSAQPGDSILAPT